MLRPVSVMFLVAASLVAIMAVAPAFAVEPHAGMLRFPDVSAAHIAFVYANDVWLVPREGGVATPLASPAGMEYYPRFSPDGRTIAFVGNYDGNRDLYTIPVSGGTPFRVTYHPTGEALSDWTPDGKSLIFAAYALKDYPVTVELFTVPAAGGLFEKLPVPYGMAARVSPDGEWLAYTPYASETRTWKRYMGGMAGDVWLFNLKTHGSKKITDWKGNDAQPMWHGDRVYYISDDGPSHRLNVWCYDTKTGERRQVTRYSDYDVKYPSVGPGDKGRGEIVFQYGPELRLLDLETEEARTVKVTIPGAAPKLRVQAVDEGDFINSGNISSTGKRAVFEARGDIWTVPAEKGTAVNLTRTSGVAEREPMWSPDKKWIAYSSDATGEYNVYVTKSDGSGGERKLTDRSNGFISNMAWSPDSKWLSFWDETNTLFIVNVEKAETRTIAHNESQWQQGESWSSDSNWLAFVLQESLTQPGCIWLYNVEKNEKHKVTSGLFNDISPAFDREGKHFYYVSQMEFTGPFYEDLGSTWIYANTGRLCLVPLSADSLSPTAPKIDEEKWDEEKPEKKDEEDEDSGKKAKDKKAAKESEDDKDKKKPEPVKIDIQGFEQRAVLLPVEKGRFSNLSVNSDGKLIYLRHPLQGAEFDEDEGPKGSIRILDLDEDKEKEKTVLDGVYGYAISADGKKLLVIKDKTWAIVDAKADQKIDSPLATSGLRQEVDPREEWRQVFTEAWRLQRDYFYAPNMHGVDWNAVRKQYEPMLKDCASREDVSYVIGEMIGELSVGHAYYWGGDSDRGPSVSVGMLGCDFELSNGAYRISRIVEGAPWDADARGPLSQPGVKVKAGDYLLAVNGVPVDTDKDPWAAFVGLAGKTVTITVSEEPKLTDKARKVIVNLLSNERDLRFRAWIEKNRAYVEKKTNGKVGYIYVPDTSIPGQNELVRQFFGQLNKQALIIDERWNGGGQVPTRFVELLNRPVASYWATRHNKKPEPTPGDAHNGPKCMLINGLAGSGGDMFPYLFRKAGVGKLIGMRTWGGLVGISGNPSLVDGAFVTVPRFAFFETDGTWGVEGHGVEPDMEVVDDPALMVDGGDPQLDAAIDYMLEEIVRHPHR
ncbi:MAG: PD40 domain-containing protein, partial [Candidatus Eisenbacteria bacterium]|nr:PD40 domain-containing protein [Candidatus Eisenbacteria bacterium]